MVGGVQHHLLKGGKRMTVQFRFPQQWDRRTLTRALLVAASVGLVVGVVAGLIAIP